MLDSTAIRMMARPPRGMYESFYFRGISADAQQAFWLKHNMFRFAGSTDVRLEGALILFDRVTGRTSVVSTSETMDKDRFERLSQIARDWNHVALDTRNGSRVTISRSQLAGEFLGEGGRAAWDLQLRPGGLRHAHFPHEWMYRWGWPRHKVLTRDGLLDFHGTVRAGDMEFAGDFQGMNGHNWGTAHSHAYAYANCSRFQHGVHAYFDGFSAKVKLGRKVTPWLSNASLLLHGRWYHFNSLWRAARHHVLQLDDYRWQVALVNRTHRLEVDIDGSTPETLPWVALHYDNPDRHRSVVKNTKFANIQLRLCAATGEVEGELASEACELETLLPGNVPASEGYVGVP